jgi:hypothetical protein
MHVDHHLAKWVKKLSARAIISFFFEAQALKKPNDLCPGDVSRCRRCTDPPQRFGMFGHDRTSLMFASVTVY